MKVFTCKDFKGFWPVGVAAVIVAETKERAREILSEELHKIGLKQDLSDCEINHVKTNAEQVIIIHDGEY